ncbi:WD40 repeat-like protein, partial [Stereum hirsutum FP-91666 SS1]|uniref:WD40 repeat-like protein n=1 Tax=Stereum hirsutum (strain FP-91666) TaxID=721885 RepID=UPI000444A575
MDRKAVIERLVGHTGSVMSVAFTSDGCGLVSGGFDGIICYWDLTELNSRLSSTNSETTTGIEGRPQEAEEALCTMTWDARSRVHSVAVSSDGEYIAAGTSARVVLVWPIRSFPIDPGLELEGHGGDVVSVDFVGRPSRPLLLASSSRDGTTHI